MATPSYLATNYFTADGYTTRWAFSFAGASPESNTTPYLYASDVKALELFVDVNGDKATAERTVVIDPGNPNVAHIQGSPVAAGRQIKIYRQTEIRFPLVDYRDRQAISEADLDLANRQAVFIAQETRDAASDNLLQDRHGNYDANGKRIVNIANGVDPQDAVTMGQLDKTLRVTDMPVVPLPAAAARAGRILAFDANGAPTVTYPQTGSALDLEMALADPSKGIGKVAFQRTRLADSMSSAHAMMNAQSINIWEYQHLVTSKPTLNPDTWDWTQAHLAAIAACKTPPNRNLYYPAGQYGTTETLDFGSLAVLGGVMASTAGVSLRADRDDMLLAKLNSNGLISGLRLDGNNKSLWNIMVLGNRPSMVRVESVRAKEFGFVFGSTQNGSFYSITSYFCMYSIGIFNGARNLNFFGAGTATSTGPAGNRPPGRREIIFDFDTSNPHGFGLPANITANGNDRISFFGGIFEYPDVILEFKNTAAHPNDVGRVFFNGSEFAGGGIILSTETLPAVSNPRLVLNNCEATWYDQTTPFSRGTRGEISFQGHMSFSGGARLYNRGISQRNNLDTVGIRIEDGTIYIDHTNGNNPTTMPKNGFGRTSVAAFPDAVSFWTGFTESWFSTQEGQVAITGGAKYRATKSSMGEPLVGALTIGANNLDVYTPTGPNGHPKGTQAVVENIGNGANAAALIGFRTRSLGGNNYAYHGVTGVGYVIGLRQGSNYMERLVISDGGHISPGTDNQQDLGRPDKRYNTVRAGTGTIATSDGRLKQDIAELSEVELAVAKDLKDLVRRYRFTDAVELKGGDARIHVGVIAQEVMRVFADHGLDACDYALLCYDEWEAQYRDIYKVVQVDGVDVHEPTGERVLEAPAGNRYGIRYDQLLAFIIAAL